MNKPTGTAAAACAIAAVGVGYTYDQMDCQEFIEHCVVQAGGEMAYAGSNDMARNAVTALWPLNEAKQDGRLVPGTVLFIREDSGAEPTKYKADGLGDFNHIGFYVGEAALTDTDKNGKKRVCNCAHSSASMRRVAGSTLANGWTHAGMLKALDYGVQAEDAAPTEAVPPAKAVLAPPDVSRYYTIKRGCLGNAVRRLQTWLADAGYGLNIDGEFGPATEKAVRDFQTGQQLVADGVVGKATWRALVDARWLAMAQTDEKDGTNEA